MIIANGYIQVKQKTATGIDPATGFPIAPSQVEWSASVPAQIVPVQLDMLARTAAGDSLVSARFQIYLDGLGFTGSQVRVTADPGVALGDFSVISIEPLRAVCQTRITV